MFNKFDPDTGGNVLNVPLMYRPIRNHHLIQKSFSIDTKETNLGNQDIDSDVPYITSDMLTNSEIHKENDNMALENNFVSDGDHVQKDVEVDIIVAHGVANNHDEKIKSASKGKKDDYVEVHDIPFANLMKRII